MKNSNDTIGNRTSDLPTCSSVPQPTAVPRNFEVGTVHFVQFSFETNKCTIYVWHINYVIYKILYIYIYIYIYIYCAFVGLDTKMLLFVEATAKYWNCRIFYLVLPSVLV